MENGLLGTIVASVGQEPWLPPPPSPHCCLRVRSRVAPNRAPTDPFLPMARGIFSKGESPSAPAWVPFWFNLLSQGKPSRPLCRPGRLALFPVGSQLRLWSCLLSHPLFDKCLSSGLLGRAPYCPSL